MKLYLSKNCEDSYVAYISFKLSGGKGNFEIVTPESKHVPFLKTSKQTPALELDSGNFLFTLDAILLFFIGKSSEVGLNFFTQEQISLSELNRQIPAKSLFGDNEELSLTDMVLWHKLNKSLYTLQVTRKLFCNHPKVGFWFDTVTSHELTKEALKVLEYDPSKSISVKESSENIKKAKAKAPQPTKQSETTKKDVTDAVENFLQVKLSESHKAESIKEWKKGFVAFDKLNTEDPKKPLPGKKNNLITSALPYVNNVPHLGNIIGAVLSADVFARFCRLNNESTLYICGTDEYGTATETKALAEGVTPQQICDKYNAIHKDIYSWFNISFDYFGRTSTKQQTEIAQDIFWKVHNNGYTVAETVEQLFCVGCNKFLADRFVEGQCPFCEFEDARGDQCDKCSKLINPIELKNPKCKVCSSSPVIKTSRHLFLDLPKLEEKIANFTDKRVEEHGYNTTTASITNSWLKTGLKPRCITRDLKWGTPVPHEEYKEKVFYVWFDAPIGYISITANYMKEWELWWKNPDNVTLYQFMAKDNVPFHSVIFPASLIGSEDNWTLVNVIDGIDWLQYEGTKFSKSRGIGVFGDQVMETNIPSDIYRCHLLLYRPETSDTNFTWEALAQTNNNILLNNLGNFALRSLTFCKNSFGSKLCEINLTPEDDHFIALVNDNLANYHKHFNERLMSRALECVFAISKIGNQYLQYNKPWVLVKGSDADKLRAGSVVSLATNVSALISVVISPFMPTMANILQGQLKLPEDKKFLTKFFVQLLGPGHVIGTPFPLFSKIEESTVAGFKAKFAGEESTSSSGSINDNELKQLQDKIEKQGQIVRELKASKADASSIKSAVAILLDLKKKLPAELQVNQSNNKKGQNNTPKQPPKQQNKQNNPPKPKVEITPEIQALQKEIEAQGIKVRELKGDGSDKSVIDGEVKILLALKSKLPAELQPQPSGKKGKKKK